MMMLVPMYFQVSQHASMTAAGVHLMPSVIGNAVGGLLCGLIIRRSVSYQLSYSLNTFTNNFTGLEDTR
jgi:formate/nitrite transporter FocA (FNT family)